MAAPRTQFYHPAKVIDAALHGSERAIRRAEGVSLVVGQPGTGKSLLLAMIAEHVRDDFDVAVLSGARICTRRALWQSILAEIGEPYRGIDEAELRIALVERIRGLAATGSGLVVLVDEAQTLPTRLLEELRLLTNVPTPLPAVHIVLAGSTKLEELLGLARMEALTQRIAVRNYLEPLEHAETVSYLRTQTKAAGLDWNRLFDTGCDDAVFTATDGVPRLINQLCDHALVLVGDTGRRVTPADIAAAWRDIQRLPATGIEPSGRSPLAGDHQADVGHDDAEAAACEELGYATDGMEVVEFGGLDDERFEDAVRTLVDEGDMRRLDGGRPQDPWEGPEVELVFDASTDPFAAYFEQEKQAVERFLMQGPDDFSGCRHVASREGDAMGRHLESLQRVVLPAVPAGLGTADAAAGEPAASRAEVAAVEVAVEEVEDDADMVLIEEDLLEPPTGAQPSIFAVRPGDYRSLFTRLRRGDRGR